VDRAGYMPASDIASLAQRPVLEARSDAELRRVVALLLSRESMQPTIRQGRVGAA